MAEKSSGKQMSINVIASLISFAVTTGINFFLTPYLTQELGTEACGLMNRTMEQCKDVFEESKKPIDFNAVENVLNLERNRSEKYFNEIL